GVDDVLDEQHVFALDGVGEVLRDLDDAAGAGALAVAADAEELDADVGVVDGPREVGGEDEAALEHAHQHDPAAGVVRGDLRAQLADARGDLLGAEHGDDLGGRHAGGVSARPRDAKGPGAHPAPGAAG